MKVSIVIVNYNVANELKQCLVSLLNATQNIDSEIFVVDNNSTDNSCEMIKNQFPTIRLIENNENIGFAKANNQAIRQSLGEYILLLNPDTIIEENSFKRMLDFMENHDDCGGLGIKMVDEKGKFLPESKRGIPTPFVAFCKMSGLYKLFPKSDVFNHYYLGAISENEVSEVEILAGACMLLRKSILDIVGLLDEHYFLYGEDIDISYRILLNGYKNYYLPTAQIIHKKGASTKKSHTPSIKAFYNAMEIFIDTHWTKKYPSWYCKILKSCVKLKAWLAIKSINKS